MARQDGDQRTRTPIVAVVSLNEAGHPIHVRITAVSGFSSEAISHWAKRHLMPGSQALSDGLACFRAVTTANCHQKAVVRWQAPQRPTAVPLDQLPARQPQDQLQCTFHAFNFDKYARRYLGGYCFRFNRHFAVAAMTMRIANAICCCKPVTERALRVAEAHG